MERDMSRSRWMDDSMEAVKAVAAPRSESASGDVEKVTRVSSAAALARTVMVVQLTG